MKLSERLEAACTGVLVAEATGNLDIVTDAVNKLLDAAREAAELARRVEAGYTVKVTHWEQAGFAKHGLPIPDEGTTVRIVPEAGLGGGEG